MAPRPGLSRIVGMNLRSRRARKLCHGSGGAP
jgi:hypothetical protein